MVPVFVSTVNVLFRLNPVPFLVRTKLVGSTQPKIRACWKKTSNINCVTLALLIQHFWSHLKRKLKWYCMDYIIIWYCNFKRKWPRIICLICLEHSNYEVIIYIMKYFFAFHNKMRAASIAKNIARVGWLCIFQQWLLLSLTVWKPS